MATLSKEDQLTLMEEARQYLKDAIKQVQRGFEAEAKRRGNRRSS